MEKTRNVVGVIILLIIILTFAVGGFFLMRYMTKDDYSKSNKKEKTHTKEDVRIDNTKDYIYYENGEEFIEEAEITKQDVVLNFVKQKDLNSTLHQELENLYKNVTYIKDTKIPDGTEYTENEKGIYSVEYRDYIDNSYGDYVSLVVLDFKWDAVNSSVINNIKGYIINKTTGELIEPEDLLEGYSVSEDFIINRVTKRLNDTQVMEEDKSIIDVDATIKSIKNSDYYKGVKALSINKNGKLTLNFIVKTTEINYNDSVELN